MTDKSLKSYQFCLTFQPATRKGGRIEPLFDQKPCKVSCFWGEHPDDLQAQIRQQAQSISAPCIALVELIEENVAPLWLWEFRQQNHYSFNME